MHAGDWSIAWGGRGGGCPDVFCLLITSSFVRTSIDNNRRLAISTKESTNKKIENNNN